MMKPHHLLTLLASVLLLAGCGRKEQAETEAATPAPTVEDAPSPEGRAIAITGNDQMKFSVTEIRVKPGETLSVTLSNIGTMPKFSMGHNWVLLTADADVSAFVNAVAGAPTTEYIPDSHQDKVIVATKLLGPKEADTVTFQAPTEPGRYVFLCSFPGHFQVGMKGEMIVE